MKKILLFGSATADVTLRIDHLPTTEDDINPTSQKVSLGGCASNVSWMLKLFEVPYTFAAPVGKGLYGDFVRKELAKRNVPVWKESEEKNGSCTCLVTDDGNRTFLAVHGAEYHYRREWLDSLDPDDYQMVYVCGLDLEEEVNDCVIDWLETSGLPVCFAAGPRIAHLQEDRIQRLIALQPILHLNHREAQTLLKRINLPVSDIRHDAKMLAADTHNLVIITQGEKGCVVCNDDEYIEVPSFPVRQIDGTGAGDSHIGTVLACLSLGKSLQNTLQTASIVASGVIQEEGPVLSEKCFAALKPSFPREQEE